MPSHKFYHSDQAVLLPRQIEDKLRGSILNFLGHELVENSRKTPA
jgi:hypothetical protein